MSSATPPPAPPTTPPQVESTLPRWVLVGFAVGGLIVIALLAAILGMLASGSDGSASPSKPAGKTFTVSGELTLTDAGVHNVSGHCFGTNGYDDMQVGAQVVVRDADGKTVGVSQLDAGTLGGVTVVCTFPFTVEGVPSGKGPYSVEVSHRGQIAFEESQAHGVSLTLG